MRTVFKYTGSFVLNQSTLAGKGLKALHVLQIYSNGFSDVWLNPCSVDFNNFPRVF